LLQQRGMVRLMRKLALLLLLLFVVTGCGPTPAVAPPQRAATTPPPTAGPLEVRKSPNDKRVYRAFTLDNGLRVLVVSDRDSDMASAALNVDVGAYDDPADRPGLAHFLEHMLFMGTEPFPDVDEYRKYIKANGGGTNAFTSGEHTAYFFELKHDALAGALDRFAPFFVSPLLDPKYVERERKAVDSEYRLKIKDANRREQRVLDMTTNPAHPASKFSVGNLDTLADRPGDPVYEDLRAFYEAHYGPDRMTLAVIGREDLDTLQAWVTSRFSSISGKPSPRAPRSVPFLDDQLGVRIDIKPLRDARSVELQWALPPQKKMWPKRPHHYISNLIGHEGEGTLFAHLKAKGWIESLSAGASGSSEDHDLFSISIALTTRGHAEVDAVVDATFQYLRLLRKQAPPAFLHDEMRRMGELSFEFLEESSPMQLVQACTAALHDYPTEHVLDWWATWSDHDGAGVSDLLSRMTVEKVRVIVTSPDAAGKQVEPLYDVPWSMRRLSAKETARWKSGAIDPALAVPAPNPWLPSQTELRAGAASKEPILVSKGSSLEVWHQQDTSFGAPRGYVTLRLFTAAPNDLKSNVIGELQARLIQDSLELWKYPATLARLSFHWNASTSELALRLTGYDDKQPEISTALLSRLMALKIDDARFALEKQELARDWKNLRLGRPYRQSLDAMRVVIDPESWSRPAAIATLEALTPDDVRAWWKQASSKLWAQLFVYGNHDVEAALAMGRHVQKTLLDGREGGQPGVNRTRLLPAGDTVLELEIDHDDSSLIVTYGSRTADLATEARYELLGAVLSTSFFNELRTVQQLGYVVAAQRCSHDVLPALCLIIQSNSTPADVLLERVDAFMQTERKKLEATPEAEIATIRQGVVARLREADTQLYKRSSRLHGNLVRRRAWNHDERLATAVEALDKAALLSFYDATLLSKDTSRLVVRSFGRNHKPKRRDNVCKDFACTSRKLREEHTRPR